jgi:hypothetical protein
MGRGSPQALRSLATPELRPADLNFRSPMPRVAACRKPHEPEYSNVITVVRLRYYNAFDDSAFDGMPARSWCRSRGALGFIAR